MQVESDRARAMNETRNRILDVALEVLGQNSDAGMGDIASAAGVVRRTVYAYFPSRTDLVQSFTQRAVDEVVAVLNEVDASEVAAERAWIDFVARLWPLTYRYQVLRALRRGEYGKEIRALLEPVDKALADLVQRGQDSQVFGRHLPAGILSQVAFAAVFLIAASNPPNGALGAREATVTSLLVLGVPEPRATVLVGERP